MSNIPPHTCFVEREGEVHYVTNWQDRTRRSDPVVLIRLSARHVAIFRALRAKGRSQKTIYYALFVRDGRRDARATRVAIDLKKLSAAELASLANGKLVYPVPSLIRLPKADLRNLVRSVYALAK